MLRTLLGFAIRPGPRLRPRLRFDLDSSHSDSSDLDASDLGLSDLDWPASRGLRDTDGSDDLIVVLTVVVLVIALTPVIVQLGLIVHRLHHLVL